MRVATTSPAAWLTTRGAADEQEPRPCIRTMDRSGTAGVEDGSRPLPRGQCWDNPCGSASRAGRRLATTSTPISTPGSTLSSRGDCGVACGRSSGSVPEESDPQCCRRRGLMNTLVHSGARDEHRGPWWVVFHVERRPRSSGSAPRPRSHQVPHHARDHIRYTDHTWRPHQVHGPHLATTSGTRTTPGDHIRHHGSARAEWWTLRAASGCLT
jgi:hypothetical protein